MRQIKARFNKGLACGIIIVLVSLFGVVGYLCSLFDFVEYKLYDIRARSFVSSSRPSGDIAVILLDKDSIDWGRRERGWYWPWPREAYAELVDYLNLGGAVSAAFDVLFSEPSPYGDADDRSFAGASSRFRRVVQTVFFSGQEGNDYSWPDDLNKPLIRHEDFGPLQDNYDLNKLKDEYKAQFPVTELRNAAAVIGNASGYSDSDGVFRRADLFAFFDGRAVPGLPAASLIADSYDEIMRYDSKKRSVRWGNYTIPVDRNGRCILRFRETLESYTPYYAYQVLQSAGDYREEKTPLLHPEVFAGRYVFFGFYAAGLFDICTTPVEAVYPEIGMHITMLDNILQQDFICQSPLALDLFVIVLPVILTALFMLFSQRRRRGVLRTILIFAVLIIFCTGAYRVAGIWVHLTAPLFCTILTFICSVLYTNATEGSQKRFIKYAFSNYLASSGVKQIIEYPSRLNLGGEKRTMTAVFTDIQGFSSISEALLNEYADEGPKVLVNLLNLYLTEMSSIILENGGTVDKYAGGAIIAFFGAPVWTEKHATLACRSAVQMKKREIEMLNEIMNPENAFRIPFERLIEKGILKESRPLFTRFGINTGDMVVGDMGTPNKMNYTVMGNAANFTARLEGMNKKYKTGGILISEFTKNKIENEFVIRSLSRIQEAGTSAALRLYELFDFRDCAPKGMLEMTELWENGFRAYEKKEFLEAKNIFTVIYEKNKEDGAAKLYMERCRSFLDNEPLPVDFPIDDLINNL